jgi:hypothetical protein
MTGSLFVTAPLNPNCMLGSYEDYPRGTPEWAEALAGYIQMHYQHATRTRDAELLVRDLKEALRERPYPWDVWPDVASPDGHAWLDRLLLESGWKEHLADLLARHDPGLHAVIAGLIAQVEAEVRTPGNPDPPPKDEATGKFMRTVHTGSDTSSMDDGGGRDHTGAQGIRRRLQKRADEGDAQAQALVAALRENAISVNQAAIQAGMRAEYIRISKDDPIRAAAAIRRHWSPEQVQALCTALSSTC